MLQQITLGGAMIVLPIYLQMVFEYDAMQAGLSLALGAFLGGMLISETEYRYQVEEDIKPFRDVLLGLFFVTVGMLLNVRLVIENWANQPVMLNEIKTQKR